MDHMDILDRMFETWTYYQDIGVEAIQFGHVVAPKEMIPLIAISNSLEAFIFLPIPATPDFPWRPK